MRKVYLLGVVCLIAGLAMSTATAQTKSAPPQPKTAAAPVFKLVDEQGRPLPAPADSLAELKKQIDALRKELTLLKNQLAVLKYSKADAHNSVALTPSTPGKYERIDTEAGGFLISVGEVTPYLDGHKLQINIGNTSTGTFSGFKLKLWWFPDGPTVEEKEESFTEILSPGAWTTVTVVLPKTRPQDLGSISATLDVDTVRLSRR
jgi:hypothetical protein